MIKRVLSAILAAILAMMPSLASSTLVFAEEMSGVETQNVSGESMGENERGTDSVADGSSGVSSEDNGGAGSENGGEGENENRNENDPEQVEEDQGSALSDSDEDSEENLDNEEITSPRNSQEQEEGEQEGALSNSEEDSDTSGSADDTTVRGVEDEGDVDADADVDVDAGANDLNDNNENTEDADVEDAGIVKNYEELNAAVCKGGEIKLGADILLDKWLGTNCDFIFSKDLVIDFNGFTITSSENRGWNVDVRGARLTLKDSANGGGYTQLGKNNLAIMLTNATLVLDGGTLNVTTWGVALFHDSELVMNGGEIRASDGFAITGNGTSNPTASNYGSNTRITINGGKVISENDYAIYHPQENGTIVINDGEITGSAGAIAANRGDIVINGGSIKSLGTADTEGSVEQDGTRGYTGAVIGIAKEYGAVKLRITGGNFVAEGGAAMIADPSGLNNDNEADIEINGGTFSELPDLSQIADGYDVYDLSENGPYVVDKKIELDLPRAIYLQVGDENVLGFSEAAKRYTTISADEDVFEVREDDVVAATGLGVREVEVDLHNHIYRNENKVKIVVYEVVAAEDDSAMSDEDREKVRALVAEDIKNVLKDGRLGTEYLRIGSMSALLAGLEEGKAITTAVDVYPVTIGQLHDSAEAGEYVEAEIGEDEAIVATYDGYIVVKVGARQVAIVYELPESIEIELEIPEEYLEAPEGYQRNFSVIRGHLALDGTETATRLAFKQDGNKVRFSNSRFSSFTIVYADAIVEEENNIAAPNTGVSTNNNEGIVRDSNTVLCSIITIITLCGTAVFVRRKTQY